MKDQRLAVRDRLGEWRDQYKKSLKNQVIEDAIETAEWCCLAFTVFEEGAEIETSYPNAALISATKFGARAPHRPATAQPVAFAAYYLEQRKIDRATVHSFVEALLQRILDQSELRKLMSGIRKRLNKAADAVSALTLKDVTEETLKEQATSAQALFAEINEEDNRGIIHHLQKIVTDRVPLLQRIRAGEFLHSPPVMMIGELKVLASTRISGEPLRTGEATIKFSGLSLAANPARGALICSVPAWYPEWRGEL